MYFQFKQIRVSNVGQLGTGLVQSPEICGVEPRLVGSPNEADIRLDNIVCRALVDTGSVVSTMSESFYRALFRHVTLRPLTELLEIESASGHKLPYLGYVLVNLSIPDTKVNQECLILVVQDTRYNAQVPVILGTNILHFLVPLFQHLHGVRFLQTAGLSSAWSLAFQCVLLQTKRLKRQDGRLGLVRTDLREKLVIPSNSLMVIPGKVTRSVNYRECSALTRPTVSGNLMQGLEVSPVVVTYTPGSQGSIPVQLFNSTGQDMVIEPSTVLCELQQVTVEKNPGTSVQPFDQEWMDNCFDLSRCNLKENQSENFKQFLQSWAHLFSKNDLDIGHTTAVKHRIELIDETPFKQTHRRIPPSMIAEVKQHLHQLLEAGIIRPSYSPWASNIVLVRKSNGELRMCQDYRRINNLTIPDAYSLPRIDELLDLLAGSKYFSVLDLKSGYYQVEVAEEHKERTAFTVGPLGFFEQNRLPFGLRNAPATFQRLMERCLGDLSQEICSIYIDDVVVFSSSFEEHLSRLGQVFDRLDQYGLKLNPKKCQFFRTKLKYLGYIVSEEGVQTDPDKISKVKDWPQPQNEDEVRKFVGFAGYYRKFVKDFSKLVKPLQDLVGSAQTKKARNNSLPGPDWHWGDEQEQAFVRLKEALTTAPVLAYPDYSLPFELKVDASRSGLGAVLYQVKDGAQHVISYASRGLTKAERQYPIHKLEFLALKWSVTKKYHDYLYGNSFKVFTDNNPLVYVLTSAKLDAVGQRWLASLADYNFSIHYRTRTSNIDADAMSRLPGLLGNKQVQEIDQESVKAVCNCVQEEGLVETMCLSHQILSGMDVESTNLPSINWKEQQRSDPLINQFCQWLDLNQKPPWDQVKGDTEAQILHKEFSHLVLLEEILYRKCEIQGRDYFQLVLPRSHRKQVLKGLHNDVGHPAKDRTLSLMRERFYWPKMSMDVTQWVENCDRCLRRKSPFNTKAPLVSISSTQPMELVCIDFLTLEESKGGYGNILVVTDHYTRYAQAFPTRNQTAQTTARILFDEYFVHYGFPKSIHSDQGRNFESKLIGELCKLAGINKSRTTPYHAMGNGMVERFNRTLLDMLGTLDKSDKINWKSFLRPLVHAYNCTRHESTGFCPFFLMFGRNPRLPIDVIMGTKGSETGVSSIPKYVENLKKRLNQAYEIASANADKARKHQKRQFDRRIRGAVVCPGDRVLVKKVAFDPGKHKLEDRWESDCYVVLQQSNPEIPVFVVQKENGLGPKRTLHRNLLLPISSLPLSLEEGREGQGQEGRGQGQEGRGQEGQSHACENQNHKDVYRKDIPLGNSQDSPEEESSDGNNGIVIEIAKTIGSCKAEETEATGQEVESGSLSESVSDAEEAQSPESTEQEIESDSQSESLSDVEEAQIPVPQPRRSQRIKGKPAWMGSGEYVMAQSVRPVPAPRRSRVIQGHTEGQQGECFFSSQESKVIQGQIEGQQKYEKDFSDKTRLLKLLELGGIFAKLPPESIAQIIKIILI